MKVAALQISVTDDKLKNLRRASEMAAEAASNGAELLILPEMFCCPYENRRFKEYAEEAGGQIWSELSRMARDNSVVLVGGSFPEKEGDRLYNSCFVFDESGRQIARHRKLHMFDINVRGGQSFKESETLSAGEDIVVFDALGHRFGLAICFDIRFPELFRCLVLKGAEAVVIPASFNMTTGPMHWELCFRSRAVDNQCFTIGAAAARETTAGYVSYGNSLVCDPWGRVIANAGADEAIMYCELDFTQVGEVRAQLPFLSARRPELYSI